MPKCLALSTRRETSILNGPWVTTSSHWFIALPEKTLIATKQNAGLAAEAVQSNAAPPPRSTAAILADLVGEESKLKALSLRGSGVGDDEAAALAQAIEANTTLCSLNLFNNAITDVG